jgi:hypothetical protein
MIPHGFQLRQGCQTMSRMTNMSAISAMTNTFSINDYHNVNIKLDTLVIILYIMIPITINDLGDAMQNHQRTCLNR